MTTEHLTVSEWPLVATGLVSLRAPHASPRQITAARGHLWPWVGDARPLLA